MLNNHMQLVIAVLAQMLNIFLIAASSRQDCLRMFPNYPNYKSLQKYCK